MRHYRAQLHPHPIDLSSGAVYLTLYGTGIRNRSSLDNVAATIGGVNTTGLFAGPQGTFVGLDQVNVQCRQFEGPRYRECCLDRRRKGGKYCDHQRSMKETDLQACARL